MHFVNLRNLSPVNFILILCFRKQFWIAYIKMIIVLKVTVTPAWQSYMLCLRFATGLLLLLLVLLDPG